jgi:predicted nucleotidyltransferase
LKGRLAVEPDLDRLIEAAAAVLKAAGADAVYLFGSAAHGTMRADSDVDLAVTGIRPSLFFRAMSQAEDILQRPLDLIDLDVDTPFTRYLKQKGQLKRVA